MEFEQFTFASICGIAVQRFIDSLAVKLLLLTLFVFIYFAFKLSYWKRRGITNAALSGFTQFMQPLQFFDSELYKKYGKIVGIYEFLTPSLLIGDPQLARRVLVTDFHKFPDHRFGFDGGSKLTENGLFGLKYRPWKRVRPIVSGAFSISKIKLMVPLIKTNVENLMENMEMVAVNGKPVDVKINFSAFTIDVILNCVFGTEVNAFRNPENKLVKHAKNLFGTNVSLGALFFIFFPKLARKFNFSLFDSNSLMYLCKVVEEISRRRKESGVRRDDLLQTMLDCVDNSESNHFKSLTLNEVIDQGMLFIVAGHDTTAATLSSAAYCLALYPECQQKLVNEIDSIDEDKLFDYETIDKLKYLDSFLKEVLRLMPTVPRLERRAVVDCQLGDIFIPKGTLVILPVYAMHRDNANFENADQFIPERFMDSDEKNYAYQPFATGPRNCVGMKFAILEMKLCLVSILRKYKFEICSQTAIPLEYFTGQLVSIPKDVTLKIVKSRYLR